jgi:NADH-quinone oxidoreductase subunit G
MLEGRQTGLAYDVSSLSAVNFNSTIAGVETADVILLVGSNLRWEAPLVNTRVRKAIKKGAKVFAIGPQHDLTYKVEWLGNDAGLLAKLPKAVVEAFKGAQRPLMIVGGGVLAKDGAHGACAGAGRDAGAREGRLERLQRAALRGGAHGRADAGLCHARRHQGDRGC